jgi:methylphosphotriester-DNA--protein-cysteine methyltransferase
MELASPQPPNCATCARMTSARRAFEAEALQAGQSLTDAASTAGFADQAHLTRQMREMMGLTPAAVLPILRGQSLHAT